MDLKKEKALNYNIGTYITGMLRSQIIGKRFLVQRPFPVILRFDSTIDAVDEAMRLLICKGAL